MRWHIQTNLTESVTQDSLSYLSIRSSWWRPRSDEELSDRKLNETFKYAKNKLNIYSPLQTCHKLSIILDIIQILSEVTYL